MKLKWFSVAESISSQALDYYLNDQQNPTAAEQFADEIESALRSIQHSPYTYPIFEDKFALSSFEDFPTRSYIS